jgi:thymidylate synthase (FAD)
MAMSAFLGMDAHKTGQDQVWTAYGKDSRTSLESRKQYHAKSHHIGSVYCATTSTGLLMVRGDETKFGFVCGNTSPFEMAEVKLHLKMPIFIMRQWVRHRTASLNEYSARYSELSEEFYVPSPEYIAPQSTTNNQGRAGEVDVDTKKMVIKKITGSIQNSYNEYEKLLGKDNGGAFNFPTDFGGISRELARIVVPVANYTECFWKIDLHNLFHFLALRMDAHAQQEIRDYANAVYELVKQHFPHACEAFEDYQFQAKTLSRMDLVAVKDMLEGTFVSNHLHYGMSKREYTELVDLFKPSAAHSQNLI